MIKMTAIFLKAQNAANLYASKAELLQIKLTPLIINKKWEIEKTKTTQYTPFKTDITKVVLVSWISNFFKIKIPREGN